MIERLETERLVLRRPTPADMAAYQDYYASDWRATHGPVARDRQSRGRFEAILAHWQQKGFGRFVVELKGQPGGIGLVGPHFPDSFIEQEITWQLWRADVAGYGYAYEAGIATRRHAFETLGWATAVTYIHPENRSAIRLALRMGATLDPEAVCPASIGPHDVYRHPAPAGAARLVRTPTRRRRRSQQAPTLHTPRTVLRPYQVEDFDAYAAFLASPRAASLHGPYSRAEAWTWFTNEIAQWHLHGFGGLMIEVDGRLAGRVAVTLGPDQAEPDLGWALFDGYEGKGYAAEAALALREHVFSHASVVGLVSFLQANNAASIGVAERLGCTPDTGVLRPEGIDCLVYRHPSADNDGSPEAYA
ncbi:GNAT family N-acetyltransferase [Tropicimonas aquimaris]|uniref:GNAT family N-acetyltransferase n=1 Tax=Tropicimonas aquimaris TaxID=914152 RepID=A0ABW3IL77_9RHOB